MSIAEQPDIRRHLHTVWSSVAGAWERNAEYVEERGRPVTEAMLRFADPRPGERVLELACGTGSVGLAAAARAGEVVLSDVVPEMTAIAAARAEALGVENVSAKVLDLEQIDEPDASFDVVLCREGLMLVPDPPRAAAEIHRVLQPGGRAAIAVWGPRGRNPWLGLVFDTVSAQLGIPVPPPGTPHPFSLDDPDRLRDLLVEAGFSDVAVSAVPTPYRAASVDEWWMRSTELAGPLAQRIAALPAPAAEALRARARDAARPYESADGLLFPGVTLVATTRVPVALNDA